MYRECSFDSGGAYAHLTKSKSLTGKEKDLVVFKLIVAGNRDFTDYKVVKESLDFFLRNVKNKEAIEIVSGNAKGVDSLGERYAKENNLLLTCFPAKWGTFGNAAGPMRNAEMSKYADALVAFWDKQSRGTQSMVNLAKAGGLKVRIVDISGRK